MPIPAPVEPQSPPSPWVVRWTPLIAAGGTVLDVACGSGRHMRWLGEKGLTVTGVDNNAAALQVARRFGAVLQADLEHDAWPFAMHQFDAVVVTNYLWRPLLPSIQDSIKPGGVLIYETFATGNDSLGKPTNPAFLLTTLELVTAFAALTPVAYENGLLPSPARIVQRICAYKPTNDPKIVSMPALLDSLKCEKTN